MIALCLDGLASLNVGPELLELGRVAGDQRRLVLGQRAALFV